MSIEKVKIDYKKDYIVFTCGFYEMLMLKGKEGIDALRVFMHLFYTARRQATNQVWANNTYLNKGIKLGELKIKKAKTLLKELGLIEYVRSRKDDKYGKVYTKLNPIPNQEILDKIIKESKATSIKSTIVESNYSSKDTAKCLNGKSKCLNGNKEYSVSKETTKDSYKQESLPSYFISLQKNNLFMDLLKKWNTNPYVTNHKIQPSKTLKDAYLKYKRLLRGDFLKHYTIDNKWLEDNKINVPLFDIPLIETGFEQCNILLGINNYLLQFEDGYWPYTKKEKNKLPKSLSDVFFNPYNKSCPSPFLKCLYTPPKNNGKSVSKEDEEKYNPYLEKYKAVVPINDHNKYDAIKHIKNIIKLQKEICSEKFKTNEYGIVDRIEIEDFAATFENAVGTPERFIQQHIHFLNHIKDTWKKFDPSVSTINPNNGMWHRFEKWMEKEMDIVLEPDRDYKAYLIRRYEKLMKDA